MLPYDSEHLTEPEQAVQQSQQNRTCVKCGNAHIHQRGGARQGVEENAPDPIEVMAGRVRCVYWC